ncbi:MAG: hypothetical protein JWM33_4019 [Caulobacteraceae bacterium]|nr:hypothetical protein [Caulobacteraceae bacterium]
MTLAAVLMAAVITAAPGWTPPSRLPPLADAKVDLMGLLAESYRPKAEAGDGEAMVQLGEALIYTGRLTEGLDWTRKALDQRQDGAATSLAGTYFSPEGQTNLIRSLYPTCIASSASPALGLTALKIGAANGDSLAMLVLARNQLSSPCVHDPEAAVGWLEKAAALGRIQAMVDLAELYAKDGPVRKNPAKARAWRKQALANGDLYFDPMVGVSLFGKFQPGGNTARLECHEQGQLGKIVNPNPIRGLHPQTLSCYWP